MKKYEIKKDCFAFSDNTGESHCNCLNKLYCQSEECKFYKKKKEKKQ